MSACTWDPRIELCIGGAGERREFRGEIFPQKVGTGVRGAQCSVESVIAYWNQVSFLFHRVEGHHTCAYATHQTRTSNGFQTLRCELNRT